MFKHAVQRSARHAVDAAPRTRLAVAGRRYAHAPVAFDWKDALGAKNLWTEEELAISETAEEYCQERLLPRVLGM